MRHPTIDHTRGFRSDGAHGVDLYVDSAVTHVSCAVQLEIEREYPEYVRFLEPFLCKGTHQGIGGQALLVEARRCWHRDTRKLTKYSCGNCVKRSGGQVDIGAWDRLITDLLAPTTGVVGGSPVAVGDGALWRFLLVFTKCDEKSRCNECLANRTNRPFTDMRGDAAWRLTEELPCDFSQNSRQTLVALLAQQPDLQ